MEKKVILPISFEEIPYYNKEFRGDLIVTSGVLYYFPHTRVVANRYTNEIGGEDAIAVLNLLSFIGVPAVGGISMVHKGVDKSVKLGKLLSRTFRPTVNSPRIRKLGLWQGNESCKSLQRVLDRQIASDKLENLQFEHNSVPKPMRFEVPEISNLNIGRKLRFDARFDTHDFRINPLQKGTLKAALKLAGFLD